MLSAVPGRQVADLGERRVERQQLQLDAHPGFVGGVEPAGRGNRPVGGEARQRLYESDVRPVDPDRRLEHHVDVSPAQHARGSATRNRVRSRLRSTCSWICWAARSAKARITARSRSVSEWSAFRLKQQNVPYSCRREGGSGLRDARQPEPPRSPPMWPRTDPARHRAAARGSAIGDPVAIAFLGRIAVADRCEAKAGRGLDVAEDALPVAELRDEAGVHAKVLPNRPKDGVDALSGLGSGDIADRQWKHFHG